MDGIYWKDLTHLTFCTNGRTLDIYVCFRRVWSGWYLLEGPDSPNVLYKRSYVRHICNVILCVSGECGVDGIYWKDLTHLTFCTNGRTLDIPCAPGSRNADASYVKRFLNSHPTDY